MNFSLKILCILVISWIVPICCTIWDNDNRKIAEATNYFGCNLYPHIHTDKNGNFVFSSLSLSAAFGMLYYGSRGLTAKELYRVLGYKEAGVTDQRIPASIAFHALMLKLISPKFQLNIAHSVLVDHFMELDPYYKGDMLVWYKAKVDKANFASEPKEIVNKANDWVKKETKGKIDGLLSDINPENIALVLNAAHFEGTWEKKFQSTSMHTFFNKGVYPKEVPMMNIQNSHFGYASFDKFRALELPYEGNISMLILLPKHNEGLATIEESLSPNLLSSTLSRLRPQVLNVYLPKFSPSYSASLEGPLRALRVHIFGPQADFSGISKTKGLAVSDVVHRAIVTMDMQGTLPAAGTVDIHSFSTSTSFVVDHPFMFVIVERGTGMAMFMGRVYSL